MSGTSAPRGTGTDAAVISDSIDSPECFGLIVERHATSVFRYLASRTDRSSSEDLLADVFEAAFRSRRNYDVRYDEALPWLLGIATNIVRHHQRSQTRTTFMLRRLTQLRAQTDALKETGDGVGARVELHDQMERVRDALATLDDKHRNVLVLSAGLGLSYEDIARALGVRIGTVRSRLSRARTRLRELLDTDGQYTAYADSGQRYPVAEEQPE
jgi:RNA polymerase sigma-70 factor (ECF subfamily)